MSNTLITIFMVVSIISSIASLLYVSVDVTVEIVQKKRMSKATPAPIDPPLPEPEPEPEPELEIVESAPVEIPEDFPEPVSADIGIEVIDIAWPESMAKNKIYKYDPDGETVQRGDMVLVPTYDKHRHGEILRTATVVNGNYRIESFPQDKVLKKIVHIVK